MRFKGLDLNLLVALNILLEETSVSRAAERMHISQPAMSAALKRLREFFDDPLLVADGKRMVPSPKALGLRGEVRAVLARVDGILAASEEFDPSVVRRTFRIGASDYAITVTFAGLLEEIAQSAKGISFEFFAPSDETSERLAKGEIDAIVVPEVLTMPDQPSELLYAERQVVVGWSGNPAFSRGITMDDFTSADHVAVQLGTVSRTSVAEAYIRRQAMERRIAVTVHSFTVVPALLINTARLAVMHERMAKWYAAYLPISYSPMPFDFPESRMMVQYHRTRQGDPSLRWLIDTMHERLSA